MDDLSRLFADDVDAEQTQVVLTEQQLQEARIVADNAPSGIVRLAIQPVDDRKIVLATITEIKVRCPSSPISVIGFSLGGNVTLKIA